MKIKLPILTVLAAILFGCVSNVEKSNRQIALKAMSPIEMGVILPKSENLELAAEIKNAMTLAAEEFNSLQTKNSSKINLLFLETGNSKEELYTAIEVLKLRNADVIHAGFTKQCAFELKKFEETGALVNFFSQYPPIATQTENAVRIFLNGAQVCEEMTKKIPAAKTEEKKSEIILAEDSVLGKSCTEFLKFQTGSLNIKIFTESFSENEENFSLLAQSITNIDYVLLYAPEEKQNAILKSLSEAGFKGRIYASCALQNKGANSFKNLKIEKVKSAFELGKTNAAEFKSAYQKRFNSRPNLAAAVAYDAVKITANAILNAAKDAKAAKLLLKGKTFEGVSGKIEFDSYGDAVLPLELVNDGR